MSPAERKSTWLKDLVPLLLLLLCVATLSEAKAQAALRAAPAGTIRGTLTESGLVIENDSLALRITRRLCLIPSLRRAGRLLTLVSESAPRPSFWIQANGIVPELTVDWGKLAEEEISDRFGRGRKFTLTARSEDSRLVIEVKVSLYFYDNFPLLYLATAEFTNRGERRLTIDRLASNCFRLDRRLLDPRETSWKFASCQGAAYRWARDYSLVWLDPDFVQENMLGSTDREDAEGEPGGTPLIDLWAPECGLALVSAEPEPSWISLPVRVCRDGLVELALTEQPLEELGQKAFLEAGESCATVKSAVILHRLDYYDAIRAYAGLLRAQGVELPLNSPPAAYSAYWKTWGYDVNFTLGQLYAVLPQLKRIGIGWFILDDGWFKYYGDWDPSPQPGKFPDGEPGMRKFVAELHRRGFKANLWWCPQGASVDSRLAREHPDWLIQNRDHSLPVTGRGNYLLCPAFAPCREYIAGVAEKFLGDWGYDALYLDATENTACPPCYNPAHHHASPLESFREQSLFYKAIYETAQRLKPGCPVEMCICGIPHDPFKMPYYNIGTTSDPLNLFQMRRRVKLEKAFRGPTFCITDCLQVPLNEWQGWSLPEAFESTLGTGAQLTTFYAGLDPEREKKWKLWVSRDREMGLSSGEYLNLYDIAFDKPEAHVVRKSGRLYYGFFADYWPVDRPLVLRGLDPDKTYRVRDYAGGTDLGTVSGQEPRLRRAFKDNLLLEAAPLVK